MAGHSWSWSCSRARRCGSGWRHGRRSHRAEALEHPPRRVRGDERRPRPWAGPPRPEAREHLPAAARQRRPPRRCWTSGWPRRSAPNGGRHERVEDDHAGLLVGTLDYMAPEQVAGDLVSPAWDVWALGVITYEMLTGHHPFRRTIVFGARRDRHDRCGLRTRRSPPCPKPYGASVHGIVRTTGASSRTPSSFLRAFEQVLKCAEPAGGRFVTTTRGRWSAAPVRRSTLMHGGVRRFCQIYWPPLYSYLRRHGHNREEAEDLDAGVLRRGCSSERTADGADPARGRFRGFLLTALKRYAINEHERGTSRQARGTYGCCRSTSTTRSGLRHAAWDPTTPRARLRLPDWAALSLDRAEQRPCARNAARRERALRRMRCCRISPRAASCPSYRRSRRSTWTQRGSGQSGGPSPRRRFGAILRLEIADTVLVPADIEDEIRELIRAVSA